MHVAVEWIHIAGSATSGLGNVKFQAEGIITCVLMRIYARGDL
jgi:hypothetical protein